jgi:hypothetical protein
MTEEAGISIGSCRAIVTQDMSMRRVAAKFVPECLTAEEKENGFLAATYLLQGAKSTADFSGNIITGVETLIYDYNPEIQAQSSVGNFLLPRGQRKLAKFQARQKCWSQFSSIKMVFCTIR